MNTPNSWSEDRRGSDDAATCDWWRPSFLTPTVRFWLWCFGASVRDTAFSYRDYREWTWASALGAYQVSRYKRVAMPISDARSPDSISTCMFPKTMTTTLLAYGTSWDPAACIFEPLAFAWCPLVAACIHGEVTTVCHFSGDGDRAGLLSRLD